MSEPLIGEIKIVTFNFAPPGWAFCDGQLLPISQNSALFSILGITYGGDGVTTFGLPDLRGRVPIHVASNHLLGDSGGNETETITVAELPQHTHEVRVNDQIAVATIPIGNFLATAGSNVYGSPPADVFKHDDAVVDSIGGGQSHANLQPFTVLHFVIALTGFFPSRN